MADPVLTLIVVTHDSARWLPGFFESWRKCEPRLPAEIVVADSGSTDDSRSVAAKLEPGARILECGHVGYGAAVNRAVATSSAPWLLICNPDLTFPTNFMKKWEFSEEIGGMGKNVFAPALVNADGTAQASAGNFPSIWRLVIDQFRHRKNRKIFSFNSKQPKAIPWATGACLILQRKMFQEVGGFDEKFFLYVEEVDLQRRLLELDCPTILCPAMEVIHHSPAASRPPDRKLKRYAARGLLRYFAKHGTAFQLFAFRFLSLLSCRLTPGGAFASRKKILERATGP